MGGTGRRMRRKRANDEGREGGGGLGLHAMRLQRISQRGESSLELCVRIPCVCVCVCTGSIALSRQKPMKYVFENCTQFIIELIQLEGQL